MAQKLTNSYFGDDFIIKAYRTYLGLSQSQFGKKYNLPQNTISDLEQTKAKKHTPNVAQKIATIKKDASKNTLVAFDLKGEVVLYPNIPPVKDVIHGKTNTNTCFSLQATSPAKKSHMLRWLINIITAPFKAFWDFL